MQHWAVTGVDVSSGRHEVRREGAMPWRRAEQSRAEERSGEEERRGEERRGEERSKRGVREGVPQFIAGLGSRATLLESLATLCRSARASACVGSSSDWD